MSSVGWGCNQDLQGEKQPCSALSPRQHLLGSAAPTLRRLLSPGRLGKTPLLRAAGVEVCRSRGAVLAPQVRAALPAGEQSAGTAPATVRAVPPCFYQMPCACRAANEAPVSLSEQFPLWWCWCVEVFGLFPFPSLPVPLPSEAPLALRLSRCSWVSSTLGK